MEEFIEIKLKVSTKNEATESPYWLILDPHQMFRLDVNDLASMITGPFFSREEAQNHLERRNYGYSKHAMVYCMSGYYADQYRNLVRLSNGKQLKTKELTQDD